MVIHLEGHPKDRANNACRRASYFGNYTFDGVKDILKKAFDMKPLPVVDGEQGPIRKPRYARDIAELHQRELLEDTPCAGEVEVGVELCADVAVRVHPRRHPAWQQGAGRRRAVATADRQTLLSDTPRSRRRKTDAVSCGRVDGDADHLHRQSPPKHGGDLGRRAEHELRRRTVDGERDGEEPLLPNIDSDVVLRGHSA